MEPFKFVWKIINYDYLFLPRGKSLKSPTFNISTLGSTYLELYPRGDILDPDEDCIIIRLKSKLSHTVVDCDLVLINNFTYSHFTKEKFHEFTTWRFRYDNPISFTASTSKNCKDSDHLTFCLMVICQFLPDTYSCKTNQVVSVRQETLTGCKNDMMSLSKDIENIYSSHQFSDFTLCAGKEKFPVHKAIICSRIPKLINDAKSEEESESSNISKLPDVEPEVLKLLLSYAYSGRLSISTCNIPNGLYKAAEKYELSDLKQKLYCYPTKIIACSSIKVDHKFFIWAIKDLYKLELNEKLYSPAFTGGIVPLSDLNLVCYLVDNSEGETILQISVRRLYPDKDNPIFVKCTITVGEHSGLNGSAEHIFNSDEEWHFPSFLLVKKGAQNVTLKKKDTPDAFKHVTAGLTLQCDFFISGGETSYIEQTQFSSEKFENIVRQAEDVKTFCCDLGQLYNIFLPKMSDVSLRIGDVRFPAHKAVLAARSPVFSRMFENDMVEKKSGIVKITDIDIAVLNMMLSYIYSAKLEILNYENAVKLYSAADKYEVTSLKERCASFIKVVLSNDNVCDMLMFADMHMDQDLKTCAKKFICDHANDILGTNEFKSLIDTRADLASEVLHSLVANVLSIKTEE